MQHTSLSHLVTSSSARCYPCFRILQMQQQHSRVDVKQWTACIWQCQACFGTCMRTVLEDEDPHGSRVDHAPLMPGDGGDCQPGVGPAAAGRGACRPRADVPQGRVMGCLPSSSNLDSKRGICTLASGLAHCSGFRVRDSAKQHVLAWQGLDLARECCLRWTSFLAPAERVLRSLILYTFLSTCGLPALTASTSLSLPTSDLYIASSNHSR